jgi:hypothetical protein
MLMAIILICSVAIAPDLRACSVSNARAVIRVPEEFMNPITCFMHGQAYLAETSIVQDLGNDDRIKIICERREIIDAAIPRLTTK